MHIIVCIKQVPNAAYLKIDPETGTFLKDGVPSIINPDDKGGIEEALRIKEKYSGSTVTVVCMGPDRAKIALREAFAMGADNGFLISDFAFGGSDTRATSYILASTIRQYIPDFDLIICGRQAIGGDTAQVGPQLAEELDLPQITYVSHLEIDDDKNVIAYRNLEKSYLVMKSRLPLLLTAIKEMNNARLPSIQGIKKAFHKDIKVITNQDLKLESKYIGFDGSPTKVIKSFVPHPRQRGEILHGNSNAELVDELFARLISTKAIVRG